MKIDQGIMDWLLNGDASINYQVHRDLLDEDKSELQNSIESKGWGAAFLSKQRRDGHWGMKFYQPKWTSSHYTLQDLRNLCISPKQKAIKSTITMIAREEKGPDGGINPAGSVSQSDACINGMFLNYASYFRIDQELMLSVVDFILSNKMPDGGFNCRLNRSGAKHSSMHTSISILEGIAEYRLNNYEYRLEEMIEAELSARKFLLQHQLFKSDRTGEIINEAFLKMPYPYRWRYDYLRALDYFRHSGADWHEGLLPAIDWMMCKKKRDGKWKLNAKHPGKQHFEMEKAGQPSRWNTLRALRILKYFNIKS